jgi:hypothetical protein
VLEWLGLADSLVALALDVGDRGVDALEDLMVLGCAPPPEGASYMDLR